MCGCADDEDKIYKMVQANLSDYQEYKTFKDAFGKLAGFFPPNNRYILRNLVDGLLSSNLFTPQDFSGVFVDGYGTMNFVDGPSVTASRHIHGGHKVRNALSETRS